MTRHQTDLGAMLSDSAVYSERTISGNLRIGIIRRSDQTALMAMERISPFHQDEAEIAWLCHKAGYDWGIFPGNRAMRITQ